MADGAGRREAWAFACLVAAQLVPIWAFAHFPSQDGPVHVSSAAALLALDDPGRPILREYFEARWSLAGSNFAAAALLALMKWLPPLTAEKVLLSAYAVGLPAAGLYALRAVAPGLPYAAFLLLPFVACRVLHLGFYSFVFGMVAFLLTTGYALRSASRPTALRVAGLALLLAATTLVHPFAATAAAVAVCVIAVFPFVAARGRAWRRGLLLLVATLPALAGALSFLVGNPFFWVLPSPLEKLARLVGLSALVSFGAVDETLAAATFALFAVVTGLALRGALERRSLGREPALFALACALLAALVLSPLRVGEAGHLMERLAPYTYFALALWLATQPLPRFVWRRAALVASLITLLGVGDRLRLYAAFDAELDEYLQAAPHLEPASTVLALHFDAFHAWPHALGRSWRRADPFLHAVGYLALERDLVNLRNYQAIKGYFPLAFRRERNPIFRMGVRRGPAGILQQPMSASPSRYEESSGGRVDYVLLWGPEGAASAAPDGEALLRELGLRFEPAFVSEPRGWMRVYRRRDGAP